MMMSSSSGRLGIRWSCAGSDASVSSVRRTRSVASTSTRCTRSRTSSVVLLPRLRSRRPASRRGSPAALDVDREDVRVRKVLGPRRHRRAVSSPMPTSRIGARPSGSSRTPQVVVRGSRCLLCQNVPLSSRSGRAARPARCCGTRRAVVPGEEQRVRRGEHRAARIRCADSMKSSGCEGRTRRRPRGSPVSRSSSSAARRRRRRAAPPRRRLHRLQMSSKRIHALSWTTLAGSCSGGQGNFAAVTSDQVSGCLAGALAAARVPRGTAGRRRTRRGSTSRLLNARARGGNRTTAASGAPTAFAAAPTPCHSASATRRTE